MILLQVKAVRSEGDLMKERVVLEALETVDIGYYIVLKNRTINNNVSNIVTDVFWFPDKRVNKGDLVILYTKLGITKQKVNSNGLTSHFFYWNKSLPVWNEENIAVLVMRFAEWTNHILLGSVDEE